MTAVVIHVADREHREAGTRTNPASRQALRLRPISHRRDTRNAGRRIIRRDLAAGACSRVRSGLGIGNAGWNSVSNRRQSTPLEFFPAQGAGHLSGLARFQLRQKSSRCLTDAFHVQSFPSAPELHEQHGRRRLKCPTKALKRLTR